MCRLRNEFRWRDPTGLQDKSELSEGKKGGSWKIKREEKSTLFCCRVIRPLPPLAAKTSEHVPSLQREQEEKREGIVAVSAEVGREEGGTQIRRQEKRVGFFYFLSRARLKQSKHMYLYIFCDVLYNIFVYVTTCLLAQDLRSKFLRSLVVQLILFIVVKKILEIKK